MDGDGARQQPALVRRRPQVFRNLKVVVEASGATPADVVKLNIYTTDLAHYRPHIRDGRDRY